MQLPFGTADREEKETKCFIGVQERGGGYIAGVLHSEPGGHLCEWPRPGSLEGQT